MSKPNTSRAARDSLRISSVERPGWEPSLGRVPGVGEYIYCVEGPAKVVRVLGRTSDGSRLLELRCEDHPRPFFASSSNILIRTDAAEPDVSPNPSAAAGGA